MLMLHLVLLIYVVLNNPFLKIELNNSLLTQILLIDCLVLFGYYIWTQVNKMYM